VKSRARWSLAFLVAGALSASTCATRSDDRPEALDPPKTAYIYDGLGRLRAASVPEHDTVVYSYDAVGNRVSIDRHRTDELSVIEVGPQQAAAGDEVQVWGTGFDPDPDRNTVSFGDAEADVTNVGPLSLTVVVPDDAGSGPVMVETADDIATSPVDFEVLGDPAPVVRSFSPSVVAPRRRAAHRGRELHR
jgi:YD repeat-containing protein